MEKYEWLPSVCAPKDYPAEIVNGYFNFSDGTSLYIPDGRLLHNGWGNPGAMHVTGEDLKPVPESMDIVWVSYPEKQFYTGHFALPRKEMEALFKEGFTDHLKKQRTYGRISVGVAPGGMVVVWLLGGGKTVEVGHFKAEKTQVSKEAWMPNAELSVDELLENRYIRNVSDEIKNQPLPFDLWGTYREQYTWYPQMEFQNEETLENMLVRYYNGEGFYTHGSNPEIATDEKRALPKDIQLEWIGKNEQKYGAKVSFEEEEIFTRYKKVFKENKEDKATLVIHVKEDNTKIQLSLKGRQEEIPITKAEIKVYPVSEDW
ncbi:DUF2931 family protein [Sinomicrobium sp. M5D2P9]